MLLVNSRQLLVSEALKDERHPLHEQAVDYDRGIRELREKFSKTIKFIRPGFPKTNNGSDAKGNETMLVEPTPPASFPLQTEYTHPDRGKEIWACCLTMPKLLPNQLWEMGSKRSIRVKESIIVDINKEPDLAFYLYFISNQLKADRLKVEDLKGDVKKKADKVREELDRKTAIWNMLSDDGTLKRMAQAYGIEGVDSKDADSLRFELEEVLSRNDKKKRTDPTIKGTKDFLDEMKVTDNVRLRSLIRKLLDDKVIVYNPDGRFKIGDKALMQVPYEAIKDTFNYICNFYGANNNNDKLQNLLKDVITKKILDSFDDKDITWIGKVMQIATAFKKKEELKTLVYEAFNMPL